jgi:hypothetical protein
VSTVTVCEVGLRLVQYNLCTPELTGWCMRACACVCVCVQGAIEQFIKFRGRAANHRVPDRFMLFSYAPGLSSVKVPLPPVCDLILFLFKLRFATPRAAHNASHCVGSDCPHQPAQRYPPTLGVDSASLAVCTVAVVVVVVVPALPALTLTGCACCRSISGILGILGCNPSSTSCSRWVLAVWCDALRTCLPPWS